MLAGNSKVSRSRIDNELLTNRGEGKKISQEG